VKEMTGGMANESLEPVVRRARKGDADAFGELYHQFYPRVLGLCRHLLGSREAAEDATGEVFIRVQRAMKTFDSALPFPRWLLSIASHHCIDQLRRRRVEHRLFDPSEVETHDPASLSASPLQDLVAAERRDAVRSGVEALPERYRMPLVLRYYSEMSYEQIAGALGLNRNHVATLIFRAKQELRRTLERQASAPAARPPEPEGRRRGKERVQ